MNANNTRKGQAGEILGTLVIGALVVGLFLLMMSFVTIDEGERGVVTSWGEVQDDSVMEPGVNWRLPIRDTVHTYDVREQVISFGVDDVDGDIQHSSIAANTESGTEAITDITVGFTLNEDKPVDVYRDLGPQERYYDTLITNSVDSHTRDSVAQYTIDYLHTSEGRETLEDDIRQRLISGGEGERGFEDYGFDIERVNIENIRFPERVTNEIEDAQAAEYERERREMEIEIEEAEAERKRVEAEGIRQAEEEIAEVFEGDDAYLQYLFITEALANEDAVSPIYVPMGDGGLDMFKDIDNFDAEELQYNE